MAKLVRGVNDLESWCRNNGKGNLIDEWDTEKNRNILFTFIDSVARASNMEVYWKCSKGHEWKDKICKRTYGGGKCQICNKSFVSLITGVNDLETWCIKNGRLDILSDWDIQKNTVELGLTVSTVARSTDKKVYWVCKKGHKWEDTVGHRTSADRGCKQCNNTLGSNRLVKGLNDLNTWCKENGEAAILEEWDTEKNIAEFRLSPDNIARASHTEVYWKCRKKGHSWQASPHNRTRKENRGCPFCSNRLIIAGENDLATWCKETSMNYLLEEWDDERNRVELGVTPETVSRAAGRHVYWKCEKGHVWPATIAHRTSSNSNCPSCNPNSTSYPEQFIFAYMKQIFGQAMNRKKALGKYEFDVAIPEKKAAIEYIGLYYHTNRKTDRAKIELCKQYNVQFIRVIENKNTNQVGLVINENTIEYKYSNGKKQIENLTLICEHILALLKEDARNYSVDLKKVRYEANMYCKICRVEDSMGYLYPELLEEWDYVVNEGIDPYSILPGSNRSVAWVNRSGSTCEDMVYNRTLKVKTRRNTPRDIKKE